MSIIETMGYVTQRWTQCVYDEETDDFLKLNVLRNKQENDFTIPLQIGEKVYKLSDMEARILMCQLKSEIFLNEKKRTK